jgi:hypothetical protein
MGTTDGTVIGTKKIIDNGPASARWNLVIMGDGYQSAQLSQFANDVQSFVNSLLGSAPFNRVPTAINVYRVDVSSTDSGADDPTACGGNGAAPRTYFDASFCGNNVARLLVVNQKTALAVAGNQVPGWHAVVIIVNSTKYGGSGGAVAVFSRADRAVEIGLHEMGHTAFGLADEYESYLGCGIDTDRDNHPAIEPSEANVTIDANRATNKWRDLVAASTGMPTTRNANCTLCDPQSNPVGAETVGAFEGAHYYHCKAYRPQFNCRMRALRNPFCAVCERRMRQTLAPYSASLVNRVAAVARTSGHLDVFWANTDGRIWTNWWDEAPGSNWNQHDRFAITRDAPGPSAPDTSVAAVARTSGNLDVFWEGADRRIWTNWWATGTGNGWKDHLPSTIAPSWATAPVPGTGITAVARTGAHLDVFWAGVDGKIWSNWWHTGTGNGWNDHASFTI